MLSSSAALSLLLFGVVVLLHSAYIAHEYRAHLRLIDEQFEGMPIYIFLECLVGVAAATAGAALWTKPFQSIESVSSVPKSLDTYNLRPGFMTFNHRGKVVMGVAKE